MEFQIMDSDSKVQPYFWRILADNGRELARSELLISKHYALQAAQQLKAYAETHYKYNIIPSNSWTQSWRWDITAWNNEKVVASTENYVKRTDAEHAASLVKTNAKHAAIVDKTRSAATSRR